MNSFNSRILLELEKDNMGDWHGDPTTLDLRGICGAGSQWALRRIAWWYRPWDNTKYPGWILYRVQRPLLTGRQVVCCPYCPYLRYSLVSHIAVNIDKVPVSSSYLSKGVVAPELISRLRIEPIYTLFNGDCHPVLSCCNLKPNWPINSGSRLDWLHYSFPLAERVSKLISIREC